MASGRSTQEGGQDGAAVGIPAAGAVRAQLERIVSSPDFEGSERLRGLLRYVVEETLAGRGERLKGYTIAVEHLGRDADFDPLTDPIVRVEAGRVRRSLEHYYLRAGAQDPVVIELPRGGYVPAFSFGGGTEELAASPAHGGLPEFAARGIAVLPFVDLTGDPGAACFAQGLSEELIVGLSRFHALRVVSRTAAARFRGQAVDPQAAARNLGVRFVLDGTIRSEGEQVRAAVTLTDAADGHQLWAERYALRVTESDMFAGQDEISRRVMAAVAGAYGMIAHKIGQEARRKDPESFAPYETVLWYYQDYLQRMNPAHYPRALHAFRKVAAENPDFPLGLAMLAEILVDGYILGLEGARALDEALALTREALVLDPLCYPARLGLAYAAAIRGDAVQPRAAAEQALAANPNASFLLGMAGWVLFLAGEPERGVHLIRTAFDLVSHLPAFLWGTVCLNHIRRGRYREALDATAAVRIPTLYWDPLLRAAAAGQLALHEQAAAALAELLALQPDFTARGEDLIARLIKDDDLAERLRDGLAKAGLPLLPHVRH
jgi:adenylate cyclase